MHITSLPTKLLLDLHIKATRELTAYNALLKAENRNATEDERAAIAIVEDAVEEASKELSLRADNTAFTEMVKDLVYGWKVSKLCDIIS